MKKQICTVIMVLTTAAVFSADFSLSAGAGGLLGGVFTRYTLSADGTKNGDRIKIDTAQDISQFNYGLFAFFDATYGVFSVFYQNGVNTFNEPVYVSGAVDGKMSGKGWESALGFSLLGKYPFSLNNKLSVFPLLGLDCQLCLKQRRTDETGWVYDRTVRETDQSGTPFQLADWNSFWVNLGGGLDFMLPSRFFIRGELLYGFRLMTSYETKNLNDMKSMSGDPNPKLGGVTSGPLMRLSAGYRFYTKK
jgi:hypothetical protein